MARETAYKPAGCVCPWAQVHMDMPWQKLSTAPDCPVHGDEARHTASMGLEGRRTPRKRGW